ncbi:MAG TPA: DUF2723 domain-containing protein [Candidatus Thermoplasmatota archaeon]|nr:DUF2723 domain-containing protein [Candidatus Thermoplasmatota archaeon]
MQEEADRWARPSPLWRVRLDGWLVAGLVALVVATRWMQRAHVLTTTDSILFALGMEHYDVFALQPHAPGYPVYVALGEVSHWLVPDVNTALVLLSVLFSVGTVLVLYGFLRVWLLPWVAAAACAAFAFSPAFLFNGVIATSYAADALLSVAIAWAAWTFTNRPDTHMALALGGLFSLAIGVRQSALLFLGPLLLVALLMGAPTWPLRGRRLREFLAAFVPLTLCWAVPMVLYSGGLTRFRQATGLQTGVVVLANTVFKGGLAALQEHWDRLLYFLHFDAAAGILAATCLIAWALARWRGHATRLLPPRLGVFMAAWLLPCLAFYVFIYDGNGHGPIGYTLVFLPGAYMLGALVVDATARAWGRGTNATMVAVLLLCVPIPSLVMAAPALLEPEVHEHDQWARQWQGAEAAFRPNDTAILTSFSWAHVKWYFPEHIVWSPLDIRPDRGDDGRPHMLETRNHADDVPYYSAYLPGAMSLNHTVPANIHRILVFDFQLVGENGGQRMLRPEVKVHEARLPDGWRVLYFETDPAHPTIESYLRLG